MITVTAFAGFVIYVNTILLLKILTCVAVIMITHSLKYCGTSNHHSQNPPITDNKVLSHTGITVKTKI